ncbi:uncharacterized protein DUF892 [Mariniflexile fucanivorans]|uniref:Uncharacterized protein DUF892 n=1 Tax=Mariniflexile fucanivorans TaxID=264023 RepID=A0A4R1RNH2_9FLAO|nr:DUF892 family protein [Mariniflexile fucanivorans]TCL67863.1 uncharacterized protein DUF892 [Mariniflexile fucanivorans]
MKNKTEKWVVDAWLIAEAQKFKHYEISGYGTAVRYAKELGLEKIASKLQQSLDEENGADDKFTFLADRRILYKSTTYDI